MIKEFTTHLFEITIRAIITRLNMIILEIIAGCITGDLRKLYFEIVDIVQRFMLMVKLPELRNKKYNFELS